MSSAVIAQGSVSISINPQETEARLVFAPDPEGNGWDAAAVNRLAAEKQLHAYPDQKALETFLHKAARAKTHEPMEMVFCQGIEPEDPVSEKVNWEALPIPADMAPFKKEAMTGTLQIYRIKVEKIKHEKKVKKPGALPFMPAKEETEITWEKKETREEVDVNPKILDVKYADKGTKLGTITPSTPGKPGKSVFGRPVPPHISGDGSYLLGEGISRDKNEFTARFSGFLRIGENWADIVPFARPSWNIDTGADNLAFFFNFEPGDSRFAPPSAEEVLANAVVLGADAMSLVSARELERVIARAAKTGESLEAFELLHMQQAEARVDINPEQTKAVLYLHKGVGGALPLEMKAISQAVKNSELNGCFDVEQLKAAVHSFMNGTDISLEYVLAEGIPSTRGSDREIQLDASPLSAEEQKRVFARLMAWDRRHIMQDDELDPKVATGLAFVKKGAVVASVSAASDGEAGKDIYGNVIPGLPGNDPEIKLLRGLVMHGSSITASQSGLLIMEASKKSFRGCVVDYRDAKVELHFSEDDMELRADLFREEGAGVPLSTENILKAMAASGVKKGIFRKELENACSLARSNGSVRGRLVAKGEPPIARGGSGIKWLVPISPSDLSKTVQVKSGTPIAELSEPCADGRPGYNVRGIEIPISMDMSMPIEHDDSIQKVPVGKGRRFIAARSGELNFDGHQLKITFVKTILGDAGPAATGNIHFSGEIQITGNVLPGCAVIGGSHVTVKGSAEGALISAGGKAVVALGFKGNGKGIIRARAGVETAFAERASVMSVGDITFRKGAILSTIKTNGKLSVEEETGRISGGVYQARYGIDVADVGSEKGLHTSISFGQDYLIKDQLDVCEEERARINRALSETEEKIKAALQKKLPIPDDVRNEKVRLVKLQEQLKIKIFTLAEKFEEHYDSEIRIRGTVFPGVVIDCHGRYYEFHQKRSRVVLFFDCESGQIKEKPLD